MRWGVYAHVPWCRVRCPYCAFDIVPRARAEDDVWLDGVLADLARHRGLFSSSPVSLYIGGGTPSRLRPATLGALVEAVGAPSNTVEVNPEDATPPFLEGIRDAGVDRVSLGVQSTDRRFARRLGRDHVPAEQAVAAVRAAGFRSWSVDLIFGLPEQTLDDLIADLERLLSWEPPHVSLYGLTIEAGTPFAQLESRGHTMEVDPDLWRAQYDHLVERLGSEGLHRYEVSNFARDGHRSVHNQLYWDQDPYLAVGPSAHGFAPDGRRWVNASFNAWRNGVEPVWERPTPEQAAVDALVSGLRGVGGIPSSRLGSFQVDPRVRRQLLEAGLLQPITDVLALTPAGFPVADAVSRALADALVPAPR